MFSALAIALILGLPPVTAPLTTGQASNAGQKSISSPAELTALLEKRWPLASIRRFCINERRHWNGWQNLVTGFHRPGCTAPATWNGVLYEGQRTGFDKISWYGDACDGTAETYSLGVKRGNDFWLLEIGSPKSFANRPIVEPSPKEARFIHGKHR